MLENEIEEFKKLKQIEEYKKDGKEIVKFEITHCSKTELGESFLVYFKGKNRQHSYFTKQYEKKDNMVITDDFIFIKD